MFEEGLGPAAGTKISEHGTTILTEGLRSSYELSHDVTPCAVDPQKYVIRPGSYV